MKNKIMNFLGFSFCGMCKRWNRKSQGCWYDWYQIEYWKYLWDWIPCKFGKHTLIQYPETNGHICKYCDKPLKQIQ